MLLSFAANNDKFNKMTQGIEFLYFAANPTNTKFLTDEEFSVSKNEIKNEIKN